MAHLENQKQLMEFQNNLRHKQVKVIFKYWLIFRHYYILDINGSLRQLLSCMGI